MNRRDLALASILALAIAAAFAWPSIPMLAHSDDPLARVPSGGYGVSSRDIPPTPSEIRWLNGARAIKRAFTIQGRPWLLAVTDGSLNRQAVHDPAYCFLGEGWKLSQRSSIPFAGGSAGLLSLKRGPERLEALFWFSDGGTPFDSLPAYWTKSTLRRLSRGLSGPEPLLFLLRPLGPPPANWTAAAAEIAPTLAPSD